MNPESNDTCQISFLDTAFLPVRIERGIPLSQTLTASNSPILFGCRTGLCGTCLVRVSGQAAALLPKPSIEEQEVLDLLVEGEPGARLACQITATNDLCLAVIDEIWP